MLRFTLVALLSIGAVALGQDPPPNPPADKPQDPPVSDKVKPPGPKKADDCDLKGVQIRYMCDCMGFLDEKGLAMHKKPEFKEHQPQQVKVCVKKYYLCQQHPENASLDKTKCATCSAPLTEKVEISPAFHICEGCGTRMGADALKCTLVECPKPKLRMECAFQPRFPHTNEKNWREKKKQQDAKDKKK